MTDGLYLFLHFLANANFAFFTSNIFVVLFSSCIIEQRSFLFPCATLSIGNMLDC